MGYPEFGRTCVHFGVHSDLKKRSFFVRHIPPEQSLFYNSEFENDYYFSFGSKVLPTKVYNVYVCVRVAGWLLI